MPNTDKWRAQVRRKGHKTQTKTFGKKVLAERWVTRIEADIDAGRTGILAPSRETLGHLIDRYTDEIGKHNPFGRNKDQLAAVTVEELTPERIVEYVVEERDV